MSKHKFSNVGQVLTLLGLSYVTEYKFHPTRHWRFDYALPELGIAIEYEGLYSKKSRHTSIKGFREDCRKYNEAALLGWVVIRITNDMLKSGEVVEYLDRIKGPKTVKAICCRLHLQTNANRTANGGCT